MNAWDRLQLYGPNAIKRVSNTSSAFRFLLTTVEVRSQKASFLQMDFQNLEITFCHEEAQRAAALEEFLCLAAAAVIVQQKKKEDENKEEEKEWQIVSVGMFNRGTMRLPVLVNQKEF